MGLVTPRGLRVPVAPPCDRLPRARLALEAAVWRRGSGRKNSRYDRFCDVTLSQRSEVFPSTAFYF